MALSPARLEARAVEMTAAFEEAARRNEWSWLADQFYAENCRYVCEYGGTMLVEAKSREEIRATHYGRDMRVGWEGWTFPIERYATRGKLIITHWWNRGPGRRAPCASKVRDGTDRQLDRHVMRRAFDAEASSSSRADASTTRSRGDRD